jgi:hypothetical protein
MSKVTEAEALALLSNPKQCIDIGAWLPVRHLANTWSCASGVINAEGVGTHLWVDLVLRRSPKTRMIWYKFSVFRRHAWGTEMVYQLDVQCYEKRLKNAHDMPHEHMGDLRMQGSLTWAQWSFEDVLRRFSERTKIDFEPPVSHPDDFELKG